MSGPAASVRELAASAPGLVECRGDASVTGMAQDSRQVKPGDLFFCVPGAVHDGHDFAADAIHRGAAGLVVERLLGWECPQILAESVRRAMGPMSALFHGHPSRSMILVGVTGTNGKTTVCHLLGSVLAAAGLRAETLGTLSGALTTPDALGLQHQLARWRSAGVEAVVMEASSHALHQHRVDGVRYKASVFTNLTAEHLDYHRTIEEYFAAKARLFSPELSDQAVVNQSDEHGRRLMAEARIPTVAYDPRALRVEPTADGLTMQWRGRQARIPLIGRFNAANALAAAEAALALGVEVPEVVAGLEAAVPVPGRFERVETHHPFTIVVDYAHTPDALVQALTAARELLSGGGRLRVVFGCGGDRDPAKRPQMGRVAVDLADEAVITSDNPRSEDPEAIIADVLAGVPPSSGGVLAQPDRRAAIARSLADASEGDVVVIAGRGHEACQAAGGREVPFDDRVVVRELLEAMEAAR